MGIEIKIERETIQPMIENRIKAEYRKHKSLDWAKIAASKITSDIIDFEKRNKRKVILDLRKRCKENWKHSYESEDENNCSESRGIALGLENALKKINQFYCDCKGDCTITDKNSFCMHFHGKVE